MMAQIYAVIGLVIVVGSLFTNTLAGTQIALIGIAFILLSVVAELRRMNRD